MDRAVRLSIIGGVLLVSFAVFYYLVIFLPDQARFEREQEAATYIDPIPSVSIEPSTEDQASQQESARDNVLEVQLRQECINEYNDIVASVEKFAETDLDFARTYGLIAGIFDEQYIPIGVDAFIVGCLDGKRTIYTQKDWTLSLYRDGATLFRLDYESKGSCLSAGASYLGDNSVDRFDCGLECEKDIDLNNAILCKEVCNSFGCR